MVEAKSFPRLAPCMRSEARWLRHLARDLDEKYEICERASHTRAGGGKGADRHSHGGDRHGCGGQATLACLATHRPPVSSSACSPGQAKPLTRSAGKRAGAPAGGLDRHGCFLTQASERPRLAGGRGSSRVRVLVNLSFVVSLLGWLAG